VQPGAALYSYDLRRTAQTAIAIRDQLQLEPVWLIEMREKSYGVGVGESDAWSRETFVPAPLVGERMYPELDFNSQIRSADRLIEAGEPTAQVARDFGMSRASFYRRARALGLMPDQPRGKTAPADG
jgi:hypothetical protein